MQTFKIIAALLVVFLHSCKDEPLKYKIYANKKLVIEILPENIAYYDTSNHRGFIEIHEIRLKENFYKKDSILLPAPLEIICTIGGEQYFWGEFFPKAQSEPSLSVNFHFDPACENSWAFSEVGKGKPRDGDTVILITNNKCNSIELFHQRRNISQSRESYYQKKRFFNDYIDTARLAHELLTDPYYLDAILKSGIQIK